MQMSRCALARWMEDRLVLATAIRDAANAQKDAHLKYRYCPREIFKLSESEMSEIRRRVEHVIEPSIEVALADESAIDTDRIKP